jgi:hypothetical protein
MNVRAHYIAQTDSGRDKGGGGFQLKQSWSPFNHAIPQSCIVFSPPCPASAASTSRRQLPVARFRWQILFADNLLHLQGRRPPFQLSCSSVRSDATGDFSISLRPSASPFWFSGEQYARDSCWRRLLPRQWVVRGCYGYVCLNLRPADLT